MIPYSQEQQRSQTSSNKHKVSFGSGYGKNSSSNSVLSPYLTTSCPSQCPTQHDSSLLEMDFMAHFTRGTEGHYITMLPADWSISASHDPLPFSCQSEKMLWNLSILGIGSDLISSTRVNVCRLSEVQDGKWPRSWLCKSPLPSHAMPLQ